MVFYIIQYFISYKEDYFRESNRIQTPLPQVYMLRSVLASQEGEAGEPWLHSEFQVSSINKNVSSVKIALASKAFSFCYCVSTYAGDWARVSYMLRGALFLSHAQVPATAFKNTVLQWKGSSGWCLREKRLMLQKLQWVFMCLVHWGRSTAGPWSLCPLSENIIHKPSSGGSTWLLDVMVLNKKLRDSYYKTVC